MASGKDCFETGLFLIGTAWADRETNLKQYTIVASQAKSAVGNLGIDSKFVEKTTPKPGSCSDINDRLRWVAGTIDMLQEHVKPLIDEKYGKRGGYCYQVGIDLGNLMFASGVLSSVVAGSGKILRPFLDNLKRSSIGIGEPQILEEFSAYCEKLLTSSKPKLGSIPGKAMICAQELAVWIDVNVGLEEDDNERRDKPKPKAGPLIITIGCGVIVGLIVALCKMLWPQFFK